MEQFHRDIAGTNRVQAAPVRCRPSQPIGVVIAETSGARFMFNNAQHVSSNSYDRQRAKETYGRHLLQDNPCRTHQHYRYRYRYRLLVGIKGPCK